MNKGFFVTGIGTDVGKTIFSALLVKNLDAFYWKPIQSGGNDSEVVQKLTGTTKILPETYKFPAALSPHHAAKLAGQTIDFNRIIQTPLPAPVVIEGAGGVLVPLNEDFLMIDLIRAFNLPVFIVCHGKLGTINHTLLTISELKHQEIIIAGLVVNGRISVESKKAIENFGKIKITNHIPYIKDLNPHWCTNLAKELLKYHQNL